MAFPGSFKFLFMSCFILVAARFNISSATIQINLFSLLHNPSHGPQRLSEKTVGSRMQCARECTQKHPGKCKTFMYNSETGQCTPGTEIKDGEPEPEPREGHLYDIVLSEYKGFVEEIVGGTKVRVGVFGNPVSGTGPLNYEEAEKKCQKMGTHLMSVKSQEKLDFLKSLKLHAHGLPIWIGCDDLKDEGTFVWKDDGSPLVSGNGLDLFPNGEPNDHGGNEDCVCLARARFAPYSNTPEGYTDILADWPCEHRQLYACENPLQ